MKGDAAYRTTSDTDAAASIHGHAAAAALVAAVTAASALSSLASVLRCWRGTAGLDLT